MSDLRWHHRPELDRPVLVAAFEGWNDAGEAATAALRYLARELDASPFATIDPEEFYDFTVARPRVRLDPGVDGVPGGARRIDWPSPTFESGSGAAGRDVVLLTGVEPGLRWRTFTAAVVELSRELGVDLVVTVGALLADVPHTLPVRVRGTTTDPGLLALAGFGPSSYEGPTGINGVLVDGCRSAGITSASLWATVPHYLRETASPKAALALVESIASVLGLRLDTAGLQIASAAYERQVDEMLAGEEEVADYVRGLERDGLFDDEDPDEVGDEGPGAEVLEIPSQEALAAEVERFLRGQHGDGA